MPEQIPAISREDFNWLTQTYGKETGYSHIDTKESVVHEIFMDKVLIGTAFLNCASYELSFGNGLHIRKNRLDDYKLHDKAVLIADDMTEEDEDELELRWSTLIHELKMLDNLHSLSNAREPLEQLFLDIFPEEDAEELISKLPEIVVPDVTIIWSEVYAALSATGNVVEFEWQEFADNGILALNELFPLQVAGVELKAPDAATFQAIMAEEDFAKGILDFVNEQLEAYELKIVAVGTSLDEYQSFACFNMQDFRLANAMLKMEELCLICFF
ncbi:DUF6630 family protein [Chitinophaga arvensicola]|uniref:DUF6630 domain-containing protein n=1 Tax=Chitinophaga arvensicola TaxID=29529 RepID=A0A1I0S5N4_9BACT|nr:hypothetical protein [Chitinophaga arvensicola]SEW50492.1 hypothetical protein SAMN04488122_3842 [Chitinophaga arvensicola]